MRKNFFLCLIISLLLFSCSAKREVVFIHRNDFPAYSSIFPIKNIDSEFSFQVWFNNSTGIDRVISVHKDSILGNTCNLTELGYFRKKTLFGWKRISHFKQIDFIPKVDFDMVVKKIDSLNLFSYQTHAVDSFPRGFDIPISFYIVEFKKGDRYHQFSFNTYFPLNNDWENEYKVIEDLIFKEFPFIFYTNNK